MFGTYALSAPVLWVGRRLRRMVRGAPAPGAEAARMDAARRSQYLQALGIDAVGAARGTRPRGAACRRRPRRGRAARRRPARRVAASLGGAARRGAAACTRCALHATRTQGVFGVGAATRRLAGDRRGARAPRRTGAASRSSAAAGQLLDAMLRAIGLDRAQQRLHRQRAQEPAAGQPRSQARGGRGLPAVPAAPDRAAAARGSCWRSAASRPRTCWAPRRRWAGCAARCTASAS